MEMAQQLIGVTMQEQGVSRIVAVDMDAAVSMAEALKMELQNALIIAGVVLLLLLVAYNRWQIYKARRVRR
jgi:hypothetical protein